MRISIRKNDTGYNPIASKCVIMNDGEEVKECFTCDEELGIAYCFDVNDKGETYLTEDKQSVQEIEIHGDMKIIFPAGFNA